MAAPKLIQVSQDLAYKLQDPVSSGTTDGQRLTAAERLKYILRGYRRLLRLVTVLYPDLINDLFSSYYTSTTLNTNNSGIITSTALNFAQIHDIYAKEPDDEAYSKARYVEPDSYMDVLTYQNSFAKPDLNNTTYFWSIIGGSIQILPAVLMATSIMYRPDIVALMESGGYSGSTDLDIPTDYTDILLSAAAAEAYLDIGQADLVQAYKADMGEQLTILIKTTERHEQKGEE